jgi:thiopurine S-methyltransferase
MNPTKSYWDARYENHTTGWDIGYPSTPIKTYIDQLTDKNLKILIPGAGNAYEAEYLIQEGFSKVFVMDIAWKPLENFKNRNPLFPDDQLVHADFFEHFGKYDLIIEQTFFCSFEPTAANRSLYAEKCADLLRDNGKIAGVWFDIPLIEGDMVNRPFGGNKDEYLGYMSPYFDIKTFDKCINSIPPRADNEFFGIFIKK